MADDVGQDLEVKGSTYRIPKMDDVADAVVAFTDYSESIPYSEYIKTRVVAVGSRAIEPVTKEDNGTMIVVQVDTTLQFGDLPEGFSVACVADAGVTITYQGVDKNGQQSTQYQVATVVTVGGLNILSLPVPYNGEIGGDGGGNNIALGTPPAPVITHPEGSSIISFAPGVPNENQAPALFHSAKIRRQDNADLTTETVTVDQDNMEIIVAETTAFVDYIVDVYGINEEGKGETASTDAFQLNYNKATGGTETTYTADGYLWRQHYYDTEGTFSFDVATSVPSEQFKIRLIGRGGNGGYGDCPMDWPTLGGRAGYYELTVDSLPVKSLQAVVGTNFTQGSPAGYTNTSHSSSLEEVGKAGGGGNGCRIFYCYSCSYGDTGTWGGTSNALNGGSHPGRCDQYSPQGGGGQNIGSAGFHTLWDGKTGNWGYHGSHGSCDAPANQVTPPGPGLVAITYRIGVASKMQIAADEERRRVMADSEEAGRIRGLTEAADANEEAFLAMAAQRAQMQIDHPELTEAIEAAAKADEEMRVAITKPKRTRKKAD